MIWARLDCVGVCSALGVWVEILIVLELSFHIYVNYFVYSTLLLFLVGHRKTGLCNEEKLKW